MHYEISVSERVGPNGHRRYRPLFATHPRSISNEGEAKRTFERIAEAFPEPAYQVSVTKWEERGEPVSFTMTVKQGGPKG